MKTCYKEKHLLFLIFFSKNSNNKYINQWSGCHEKGRKNLNKNCHRPIYLSISNPTFFSSAKYTSPGKTIDKI